MILITLGTQDKDFSRLLDAVQKEIDNGNINDKVIVQAGVTKYNSKDMEIFDLMDTDELERLTKSCDLLITHGGIGSILTALKYDKTIIAAPRLKKYNEHINDHQIQIIENFANSNFLLSYFENDDLSQILKKSKNFVPAKYKSNTKNIIKVIDDFIEKN